MASDAELLAYMGMDAQRWTEKFLQATNLENAGPDFVGTVLGWFANALESGRVAQYELSIPHLVRVINDNAVKKGWWRADRPFSEVVALIHSEASEALEEWRDNHAVDERYYSLPKYRTAVRALPEQLREEASAIEMGFTNDQDHIAGTQEMAEALVEHGFLKPEGVPSELADVVIRCFDAAGQYGIDLEEEILLKMKYNETRPHKHGGKQA